MFHRGELIAKIIPELWLLSHHASTQLRGPGTEQHTSDLAIFTTRAFDADGVDEALEESFLASDPPAWAPIVGIRLTSQMRAAPGISATRR